MSNLHIQVWTREQRRITGPILQKAQEVTVESYHLMIKIKNANVYANTYRTRDDMPSWVQKLFALADMTDLIPYQNRQQVMAQDPERDGYYHTMLVPKDFFLREGVYHYIKGKEGKDKTPK